MPTTTAVPDHDFRALMSKRAAGWSRRKPPSAFRYGFPFHAVPQVLAHFTAKQHSEPWLAGRLVRSLAADIARWQGVWSLHQPSGLYRLDDRGPGSLCHALLIDPAGVILAYTTSHSDAACRRTGIPAPPAGQPWLASTTERIPPDGAVNVWRHILRVSTSAPIAVSGAAYNGYKDCRTHDPGTHPLPQTMPNWYLAAQASATRLAPLIPHSPGQTYRIHDGTGLAWLIRIPTHPGRKPTALRVQMSPADEPKIIPLAPRAAAQAMTDPQVSLQDADR
ncbi:MULTISPECIES: hypothetical protein [Streptomycetaceae]|uniref:Uncharacterized protein n=2 Tax=Streptantibioticus cattleyicolor TaxID=29303 RepID=G8WR92_STREN|nr:MULTISPECIES: hypothetical protein [Streptomycetaceae]AEW92909.1 hypothetical protein SCATT_05380 [Streptantibioticus cattleyicolor NRRL 8057 = DSM 46488]MYS57659.1 hypothetical protein [Streptomyces sp. SID5468]